MAHIGIEQLPIWKRVVFQIDTGYSVLLSIPRFCGERQILNQLRHSYRVSGKCRVALVEIARRPTTADFDFAALWKAICEELALADDNSVETESEFLSALRAQVRRRKSRFILILGGLAPGMEARFYGLLKSLHVLHSQLGVREATRFQFVATDEFLIRTYGSLVKVDWSQLHTMKRESCGPFSLAELKAYVKSVSHTNGDVVASSDIADRMLECTGGHIGLVSELCSTLEGADWNCSPEYWVDRIRPTLATTQTLDSLRSEIRGDKTGLAKTAMAFVEPNYAIEYDSPRYAHLLRLGVLYRCSESQLALVGGSIRTLMEGLARSDSSEPYIGTVSRESGTTSFLEEKYVPDDDDFVVVHISDLHIGADHGFRLSFSGKTMNPEVGVMTQLLASDLDSLGLRGVVDSLVISGDIVCTGKYDEFCRAAEVVGELMDLLHLSKDRLALVPGNHDVLWEPGDLSPTVPGNPQVSRDGYDMFLKLLGKPPKDRLDLVSIKSRGGNRRMRIVGLDSNYVEGRRSSGIGYISKDDLEEAGKRLDKDMRGETLPTITWFVVHHHVLPVCDVSINEAQERRISVMGNASQILSVARSWGVEAILHGHQHQPAIAHARRWIGERGVARFSPVLVVGAGSCGAKREQLGPISYNHYYILARRKNQLLIRSRTIQPSGLTFTAHDDLLVPMPEIG